MPGPGRQDAGLGSMGVAGSGGLTGMRPRSESGRDLRYQ